MTQVSIDSLAVAKVCCKAKVTDKQLSTATGFFVSYRDSRFFVTAWHVASGLHLERRNPLHPSLALPGRIEIRVPVRMKLTLDSDAEKILGTRGGFFVQHFSASIDLPDGITEHSPYIHPTLGSKVDVVAFPVDALIHEILGLASELAEKFPSDRRPTPEIESFQLNDQTDSRRIIRVTNTVFIPGFPEFRPQVLNGYPIYKSAFVASEPDIYGDLPIFLVDGKTKNGWSGAPILFDPSQNEIMGRSQRLELAGIYSAREEVDTELYRAELGIGWRVQNALLPIIRAQLGVN